MKITDAVHEFILYKQSLGMTYKNRALKLTAFARLAGPVEIDSISPETVRRFLDAGRPVTAEWFNKFSALKMFFRFALSRGYATRNPLYAGGKTCEASQGKRALSGEKAS